MPEINHIHSVGMVTFLQQQCPSTTADTRSQWMILRKWGGGGSLLREDITESNVISKLGNKTYVCIFLFNNQPDALIIQIYSVIKLYMFRASSLPIIRSFLLYIRHW